MFEAGSVTGSDNGTEVGSKNEPENDLENSGSAEADNKSSEKTDKNSGNTEKADQVTEAGSGATSDQITGSDKMEDGGKSFPEEKSDAAEAAGKTENVSGSDGSGIYETSQSKVPETEEKQQPENKQTEENQPNDEKKTHEARKDSDNEEKTHESLDNSNNEEKNHDIQQPEAVTSAPLTETTDAKMPQEELLTKTAQTPETALLSAAAPQTAAALTSNTISSTEKVISIIGDSVQISVNENNQLEIIKGADKTTYTQTQQNLKK